jgi:putative ABC transport system permease protein
VVLDFRLSVRRIVHDRWFTLAAVFALSLGIGLNATVFTLVNAVLIRGLPFPDSHELYMVDARTPTSDDAAGASYPDFDDWRAQAGTFVGLAAFANAGFNISDDRGAPEQANGTRVSANTFGLLGQRPLLGRDFGPDDERPGAAPVVMLGHRLWTSRYGADRGVIGQTVRLNGVPATIVGVMTEGVMFPTNAEAWVPLVPEAGPPDRDERWLNVFGRLRPGGSRDAAATEMNTIVARLAAEHPETNRELSRAVLETFNDRYNGGPIRVVLLALLGAVGFVLLIACANVASLLLSRSVHRAREISVRVSLGATRWRIVRQLLVEAVLIGLLGGFVGLAIALVGVQLFDLAVTGVGKPYWIEFRMDYVVFGYLTLICIATGVVFGLAPAMQVSRTNVTEVLNEAGRGNTESRRSRWLTSSMVVGELALTIVLLVGAGLMVRSFLNLYRLDLGIDTAGLMTMRVQLPDANYPTPESRVAFFDEIGPRLAAIPGVEAAAIATAAPLSGGGQWQFEIDGGIPAGDAERPAATAVTISPTYFDVLGLPMERGRAFTSTDGQPGAEVVIVNGRFAAQYFSSADPIGRRLRFVRAGNETTPWMTIVGISPSVRHNSPQEAAPGAAVYLPYRQEAPPLAMLVVRSRLEPGVVMSAVRDEVQAVDRDQPVFSLQTMDEALARQRWPFWVFGSLFAIFAFIALVMSSVGLYAVMAYSVTQRTQEIGVRMALGADRHAVAWLVARRGLAQLAVGVAIGLLGAYFISEVMATLLVQVEPQDPVTFAAITAIVVAVAVIACVIPAWRAGRLDPTAALRA